MHNIAATTKRHTSYTVICLCAALGLTAPAAQAETILMFDTELISLNLSGGAFPIPLASDPANQLRICGQRPVRGSTLC